MTLKMKRLTAAILATMASTAYAEQQKHHFDIPAQSLGSALQTLAAQSGAPMLYAEQTAEGKQSRRLNGDYTTAEAADKLLAGSGLVHSVAENGTVTVKPAQSRPQYVKADDGHRERSDDELNPSVWIKRSQLPCNAIQPVVRILFTALQNPPKPIRYARMALMRPAVCCSGVAW